MNGRLTAAVTGRSLRAALREVGADRRAVVAAAKARRRNTRTALIEMAYGSVVVVSAIVGGPSVVSSHDRSVSARNEFVVGPQIMPGNTWPFNSPWQGWWNPRYCHAMDCAADYLRDRWDGHTVRDLMGRWI